MSRFKEPSFEDRQKAAQEARMNILNKFRSQPGPNDPAVKARQDEREAFAVARARADSARAAAKAERSRLAEEAAAARAAEAAARQAALEAEQKAARDARYAARKKKKR